ncbi:hypothetical protein [Roseivivax sediminis]|uniref:Uncharacterized protein n=1 Tax=Roseivivax sediminis TaxID=936889 RepID=A0A1I2DR74_9RHOB|nr:hypothetical protein [Roseivivax sediminis]SFE82803.1 hypothetical protein SAMN04515678_1183 [Roseivivax sediminis]
MKPLLALAVLTASLAAEPALALKTEAPVTDRPNTRFQPALALPASTASMIRDAFAPLYLSAPGAR